MYYVYILENENGKHYIGCTNDLSKRIREHNSGRNKSTKNKGRWRLIYKEEFNVKEEAFLREKQIKSYKGGEAFKKLLSTRKGAGVVDQARLESV